MGQGSAEIDREIQKRGEGGPCYRCLFPEPPPPSTVPSCQEPGVLQANEALKEILGTGKPMVGRLLLFNALHLSFDEVKFQRNPHCLLCGENPTIQGLIDYPLACQN